MLLPLMLLLLMLVMLAATLTVLEGSCSGTTVRWCWWSLPADVETSVVSEPLQVSTGGWKNAPSGCCSENNRENKKKGGEQAGGAEEGSRRERVRSIESSWHKGGVTWSGRDTSYATCICVNPCLVLHHESTSHLIVFYLYETSSTHATPLLFLVSRPEKLGRG